MRIKNNTIPHHVYGCIVYILFSALLLCSQALAADTKKPQKDSSPLAGLSVEKKAALDLLRKQFRENSVNETSELEYLSLQIEINSLGKFGGMLLIVTDKESGRVIFSEQNGDGLWNDDSILLYQGNSPSESSLLVLKLGGGGGMGTYNVDIHVYLIQGTTIKKIYTDDHYGYSNMGMEPGGFTTYEHEYDYRFEQDPDGRWIMSVEGSSKESTPRNETIVLEER